MGYADYIRTLLKPVGVYDLSQTSISGGAVESVGAALDGCSDALDDAEREAAVPTALDAGLENWETLFSCCPASPTTELRRAAICALLAIGEGDFTLDAVNRAIDGCGITADVVETDTYGTVRVVFPDTVGVPADFERIERIITDIIPCHLATEFYFRYLTWAELERMYATFADIDAAALTWDGFEQTL